MAFDDSTITDAKLTRSLGGTFVEWSSSLPEGTLFQVYVDGVHVATTTARWLQLPPAQHSRSRTIQIGAVGDDDGSTDFASSLPSPPTTGDRAVLSWYGGTYLSETIAGFRIYRSATAGGAVSYTAPIDTVPAYVNGQILDGAGLGRAGKGGAGRSESAYTWRSDPLPTGTWRFGVAAYDAAGNEDATPLEIDVTVVALPKPPKADEAGKRITYTYTAGTRVAVLNWQAGV